MLRGGLGALLLVGAIGACGDEEPANHGSGELSADCEAIMHTCHLVDFGNPGEIHDCHELAHHNNAAACSALRDACIATCAAASDAGSDGATDGG